MRHIYLIISITIISCSINAQELWLKIGGSNAQGMDTVGTSLLDDYKCRLFELGKGNNTGCGVYNVGDVYEHCLRSQDNTSDGNNFGLHFGINRVKSSGRYVVMANVTKQGSGFSNNYWNQNDSLYNEAVSVINTALATDSLLTYKGAVWLPDYVDAGMSILAYESALSNMLTALRADINHTDEDYFLVGGISDIVIGRHSYEDLDTALMSADNLVRGGYVDLHNICDVMTDTLHYNNKGNRSVGLRFADRLYDLTYQCNIAHDTLNIEPVTDIYVNQVFADANIRKLVRTDTDTLTFNVDDSDSDPTNEIETWTNLAGIPADIADGDDGFILPIPTNPNDVLTITNYEESLGVFEVDWATPLDNYIIGATTSGTTTKTYTLDMFDGPDVTFNVTDLYEPNTDTQLSEAQVDAFADNNGYLTTEVDGSITNEIQDLDLTGNNLKVTNNTSATTIDLSPYLDDTDTQLSQEQVQDFVSTMLVAGADLSATYNDSANTFTFDYTGTSGGADGVVTGITETPNSSLGVNRLWTFARSNGLPSIQYVYKDLTAWSTFVQTGGVTNIVPAVTNQSNVQFGLGVSDPTDMFDLNGAARLRGQVKDGNGSAGTAGQVLSTTGTGVDWVDVGASNSSGSLRVPSGNTSINSSNTVYTKLNFTSAVSNGSFSSSTANDEITNNTGSSCYVQVSGTLKMGGTGPINIAIYRNNTLINSFFIDGIVHTSFSDMVLLSSGDDISIRSRQIGSSNVTALNNGSNFTIVKVD